MESRAKCGVVRGTVPSGMEMRQKDGMVVD